MAGEESIEDAEQNGRLGTTKMDKNITWVVAVLKDNCRASCRMIVQSTGIPKTIVHRILPKDLKKMKTVCTIRTTGTELYALKRLNHPLYSPNLSPPDYFAFLKLKIELKGGGANMQP